MISRRLKKGIVLGAVAGGSVAFIAWSVHYDRVQAEASARQVQAKLAAEHQRDEELFQRQVKEYRDRTDEYLRQLGYCSRAGGTFLPQERICIKAEKIPIPEKQ